MPRSQNLLMLLIFSMLNVNISPRRKQNKTKITTVIAYLYYKTVDNTNGKHNIISKI